MAQTPDIDQSRYRQVLGHFPTGVTVVTATVEGAPVGMAVGSFASVSIDPPLVLFCAGKQSGTWSKLRTSEAFCVNILAEDQEDLCRQMAQSGTDKFAGVGYQASALGSPVLHDVLGWIDCEVHEILDGGDHDIVLGRVHELEVAREEPLVFFRGGYGRFGV